MRPVSFSRRLQSKSLTALLPLLCVGLGFSQTWTPVFNGTDSKGVIVFPAGKGTLTVANGELTAKGDCCGYFATEKEYSHYRMKVDFKHGGGNSGLVWHVTSKWISGCRLPSGIELNINDGGIKDIWWTDVGFKSTGDANGFKEGGPEVSKGGKFGCSDHANFKSSVAASNGTTAWNTFEIFVNGDSMEAKLNDKVWMRVYQLKAAANTPLTKGKVGFYFEGNTMTVKNWQIMDLDASAIAPAPRAAVAARPARLRLNATGDALEILRDDRIFDLKGMRLLGQR